MQELLLQIISFASLLLYVGMIGYCIYSYYNKENIFKKIVETYRLQLIYVTSFVASIGSIMLTTFFLLEPCELCWYQRSFLFSIPVISLVAIIKKDIKAHAYVFYIAIIGALFALYHSLIQSGLFTQDSVFCSSVSSDCITRAFTYFGFITIPVISLSIFLFLIILSYDSRKK